MLRNYAQAIFFAGIVFGVRSESGSQQGSEFLSFENIC